MIEETLDKLTAQGFIQSPAARKAIRAALADYAFCAAIDSDIREEAMEIAEETAEEKESYVSPFSGEVI